MALVARDLEKYDFTFQGHILVKRYLDEAREDQNICAVMDNERLETIAMHFYNLLLAAGVLNQIQINKAPMYNVLQLDLAYCWSHEVTPLTRHLSSISCSLKSSTVKLWTSYMSKNPTSDKEELNYMMKEKILNLEQEIHRLRQEIENYKTLLRLQMVKPSDMVKLMICDTIGTKESNENINKTIQCDAETQTEGTNAAVGTQTNHDLQNYHAVKDSRIPKGNPEHPSALSTSIPLSPYSPPQPTQLGNSPSRTHENHATYPKSQSAVPLSPPRPPPLYTEITSLAKFGSSVSPHSSITGIAIPPPPPMPSIAIPPPPPMPSIAIPPPPPMPGTEVLPSPKKSSTAPAPQSMQSMVIPPPPPMPVMEVPSLLRSSSGAPLPPPMPGMVVPPPPPMPGMGIPALSPSSTIPGSSVPNLPPIPSTERGIPPPPQIAGHSESLLPSIPGMSVPPLPPPPPHCRVTPKPPSFAGPVPLPPSPMGEWNAQKSAFKKPKVNPTVPMKPLYWTRILTTKAQMDSYSKPALWVEVEELPLENLPEFVELFSRQVITKKPPTKKVQHSSKVEPVKLLDSKRSRNVGILSQSLRVDVQEIENAIYNCDTSNVSLEALQQIYEARATTEELELIKSHTTAKPEVPLDKPEQFLYHLSEISHFAERISCLMFQVEFDDSISAIEHTLNNIKTTCDHLMNNPHLKDVMAIILTLGNYMNGGNISRGQADGFGLEILSKLRDVKSKDSKITLLHFIVKTYLSKIDNPLETNLPLPVPESDDVQRAASVNFDDTKLELQKLLKKLEDCEATSRRIIETSTQEHLQPFKDRILEFIDQSNEHAIAELKFLEECRKLFEATMRFYWYKPKSGALESAAPDDFFRLWHSFCKDFKDIYKKELMRLQKQKIEQILIRERQRKSGIKKIKERPDGLKAKVRRLRQIKDKEREERDRDF